MAQGRGQLSAIERLPSECDHVIAWAANELKDRKRTLTEIYEEFHAKLEAVMREHRGEVEFKIPSFSAFGRYSFKLAALTRRLEDARAIAATIAERFDAEASDDLTLIAAEAIKSLVFETITDAGESGMAPKEAMALANALQKAVQAQNLSTARRIKVEKEFGQKVGEALDAVEKSGHPVDATEVLKLIRKAYSGE